MLMRTRLARNEQIDRMRRARLRRESLPLLQLSNQAYVVSGEPGWTSIQPTNQPHLVLQEIHGDQTCVMFSCSKIWYFLTTIEINCNKNMQYTFTLALWIQQQSDGVEVQKHGTWYPSYSWLIYQLDQQNKEMVEPTVL